FQRITDSPNSQDLSHCTHSCNECIHHSCSAILGFYGSLIGPTSSNSLHDLIRMLKLCEEGENVALWESSRIHQIEGDLKAVDESLPELMLLLNKTTKFINQSSTDSVSHLAKYVETIYFLAKKLIYNRAQVSDKTVCRQRFDSVKSLAELADLISEILKRIPSCRLQPVAGGENFYWLKHNIGTVAVREVKGKIFIASVYQATEMGSDGLESYCAGVNDHLLRSIAHSNTVIFVFHPSYTNEHRKVVDTKLHSHHRVLLT